MRTFEFKDGESNKFWNIELSGKSFTVIFGKIGTAGQTQQKKFPNEAAARAAHDKLVAEKTGKGYIEKPGLIDALRQTLGSLGPDASPKDFLRHLKDEFGISPPAPAASRRTFEFKDGKSNKFWNIDAQGKSFTVTFGKIGSAGQSQEKKFRTEAAARVAYDKLVAEKLRKGYVEIDATQGKSPELYGLSLGKKLGGKSMKHNTKEVERRTAIALTAIKQMMDKGEVALFVSHHLKELDAGYWKKHAGTPRPSPKKVLDLLEVRSHWGEEDEEGIDTFDFTLPSDVTQYVISVRFDEDGDVENISMES